MINNGITKVTALLKIVIRTFILNVEQNDKPNRSNFCTDSTRKRWGPVYRTVQNSQKKLRWLSIVANYYNQNQKIV